MTSLYSLYSSPVVFTFFYFLSKKQNKTKKPEGTFGVSSDSFVKERGPSVTNSDFSRQSGNRIILEKI